MTDFSTIGRRNNLRGKAFEKRCAKILEWMWVGKVRHTLQRGDIVDGFWGQQGHWLGECKQQQPGAKSNLSVKDDWIRQMFSAAHNEGNERHPALFLGIQADQKIYVALPMQSIAYLMEHGIHLASFTAKTVSRGKAFGFVIQRSQVLDKLDSKTDKRICHLVVTHKGTSLDYDWWIMRLELFKDIIHNERMMVWDTETTTSQ